MKKIIFVVLCFLSLFCFAQEENTGVPEQKEGSTHPMKFGVEAIVTLSDIDSLFKMPADQIYLATLEKVYRGQAFKYLPLMRGVVAQDGDDYELECTLMLSKTGSLNKNLLLDRKVIKGTLGNAKTLLFYPEKLLLTFRDNDEFGLYDITFYVMNLRTQETASFVSQVELEPWVAPKKDFSDSEISHAIFTYNINFEEEAIYQSLFSKYMSFYKKGGLDNFNPLLISFYRYAFKDQEFLLDIIDEEFPSLDKDDRQKIMMLNAFIGRESYPADLLDREEIIFQNYIEGEFDFGLDPYAGELTNAFALEILWGEFFAKGNYESIARILEIFKNKDDFVYYTQVLSKEVEMPTTTEGNLRLLRGKLYYLANNYIKNYISNPLLQRYLRWSLENVDDENIKLGINLVLNPIKTGDK